MEERHGEGEALADAVRRVGDRWTLRVVHALLDGPRRFGQLLEEIDGIAPNVLSQRLKTLESEGLVIAEPYQRRPRRHTYTLTERGRELRQVLRLLAAWGSDDRHAPRHVICGTPLEARWWCSTCDTEVADTTDQPTWL